MSCAQVSFPISRVVIYKGHEKSSLLGPYADSEKKTLKLFEDVNTYRMSIGEIAWNIVSVFGEKLIKSVSDGKVEHTLLFITPGQSSHLDEVFSDEETTFIKDFCSNGGRLFTTCGSSYWVTKDRIFCQVTECMYAHSKTIAKTSKIALFDGTASGPLCPSTGEKYKVGFYSDAVDVISDSREYNTCSVYLSGGGSFNPNQTGQKVRILVRYLPTELARLHKVDYAMHENAAVLVKVGGGAALLTMFHCCQEQENFDADLYEKILPGSGTDWTAIKNKLSRMTQRIRFVYHSLLSPLDTMSF